MEADHQRVLQVQTPDDAPFHLGIANVLSIQSLQSTLQLPDAYVDDEDDIDMADGGLDDVELSDKDSDDERLNADINKLDADIAAFKETMASYSSDSDDVPIDPSLLFGTTTGHQKRNKPARGPRTTKRRKKGGSNRTIEPSADIKNRLSLASEAFMRRDFDHAYEVLSEIIRINAETYDAWMMLSSIYQERGQMPEAIMAMCFAAHLHPGDFHGWMTVAQFALDDTTPGERERNLQVAQLCYSAAIKANRKSLKARIGKANCALEAGRSGIAAGEYVKVLKQRPYNMGVLRNLAEAAFDTKSAKKYIEQAKGFYEQAIAHVRAGGQHLKGTFMWSDVIIYVEMCAFLELYSDAALALRSLSRMLIGRQEEIYWDSYLDDDREWDQEEDRRADASEYTPDRYPHEWYGPALPLDLRAKLAVYRLKLGQEEEATRHLQWLPAVEGRENFIIHPYFEDSPFVIKELADQLFENRRITTALDFYNFYGRLTGAFDSETLVQIGKCYLEMQDQATAEEMFIKAIEEDDDNIDARYELAQMYEIAQEHEEAFLMANEALQLQHDQREDDEDGDYEDEEHTDTQERKKRSFRRKYKIAKTRAQRGPPRERKERPKRVRRQYVRRMAGKAKRELYEHSVTESFRNKYQRVQELRQRMASGDKEAEDEWMAAAQDLVDDFRSFKEFYPWDKYLNFMGYGSFFEENRRKAQEKAQQEKEQQQAESENAEDAAQQEEHKAASSGGNELAAMAERLQQNLAPAEGEAAPEPILQRHEHRGIPFDKWLDLLLEYAVSLAQRQQAQEAYIVCQSARDSIVYKSSDNTFLIHVAWAACAVYAADEETCVAVARFFMRFCHATTDSYRVFSALCRVCQSPVSWYSSGPAQKYILRQIKAMDRGLLPADVAESAMGIWDTAVPREDAQAARHDTLDVTLLMLYGHILLTSTSYTYALNYFLRAAALDPTNPMVNLSTGIAYVHYAMKRQAENRQFILAQGMHYMFEYYDVRMQSKDIVERLEAHYNLARCYHLMGIFHLAAEFYSRVLTQATKYMEENRNKGGDGESEGVVIRDFVYEAAVNLRTYSLTNGDFESARAVTETWLIL